MARGADPPTPWPRAHQPRVPEPTEATSALARAGGGGGGGGGCTPARLSPRPLAERGALSGRRYSNSQGSPAEAWSPQAPPARNRPGPRAATERVRSGPSPVPWLSSHLRARRGVQPGRPTQKSYPGPAPPPGRKDFRRLVSLQGSFYRGAAAPVPRSTPRPGAGERAGSTRAVPGPVSGPGRVAEGGAGLGQLGTLLGGASKSPAMSSSAWRTCLPKRRESCGAGRERVASEEPRRHGHPSAGGAGAKAPGAGAAKAGQGRADPGLRIHCRSRGPRRGSVSTGTAWGLAPTVETGLNGQLGRSRFRQCPHKRPEKPRPPPPRAPPRDPTRALTVSGLENLLEMWKVIRFSPPIIYETP